jgi:hypothetical protein
VSSRSFPQRRCPQGAFRNDNKHCDFKKLVSTTNPRCKIKPDYPVLNFICGRLIILRDSSFVLQRAFAVFGNSGIDLTTNAITAEYYFGKFPAWPENNRIILGPESREL